MNPTRYPKIPSKLGNTRQWTGRNAEWIIQEKIDGSQFTFGHVEDQLQFFNRGKQKVEPFDANFSRVAQSITQIENLLNRDYIYHGEAICRRQHNVLLYERLPRYCFVLFDIQSRVDGRFLTHIEMVEEAQRVGLEHVPALWTNTHEDVDPLGKARELVNAMERGELPSFLGGRAEGVVVKHPSFCNIKGRQTATKVKFVCQQFKEKHRTGGYRGNKQTLDEQLDDLIAWFPKEAWWRKAIFRLRDNGDIDLSATNEQQRLKDGVKVAREVKRDFTEENQEDIKDQLWHIVAPRLLSTLTRGCTTSYAAWDGRGVFEISKSGWGRQVIELPAFLERFRGQTIRYCPNPGNAGDSLIGTAEMQLFEHFDIRHTCSNFVQERDQTLFYGGGGNLNDMYTNCAEFLRLNAPSQHNNRIVLMPHTIMGREQLLRELPDTVTILCREPRSYDHVCKHFRFPNNVYLTHDSAMYTDVSALLESLCHDHDDTRYETLFAFRQDGESCDPGLDYDKSLNIDVSTVIPNTQYLYGATRTQCAREFLAFINRYQRVYTNRLHVAVAAALLGKIVDMYPNNYWKNEAVYRHSFAHFGWTDHVTFHE